ncbi:16S rRNA (uracil(1498)-N(3))-methyltransferase [Oscillatoria sp. CS-180]|uniref:16S rRNA (uracil(1498)-N(3))-methyltransferase n=1 Tax=Oscillatoria sp. CS-180 TaxID=3021720 RepID=UPI00232E981C|nr:16S rRNA (uracil(1498)-N(3))-methyltransferase [Oscillatoria sp. CS-180]MDB9524691.1 16S rRNA (uracil(1498)-N(3))-methyltransferase [Oscillatoria sp. CS-180]
MQRIVVDVAQVDGDLLRLTPDQQHYLERVLRLQRGDRFLALDGQGTIWLSTLSSIEGQAHLSSLSDFGDTQLAPDQPYITLAACLPKQGFDEVVRQVTELGVHQVVPILSDRTLLRPSVNKLERWRRIATEATEQSERLVVTQVREPMAWSKWLETDTSDQRYLCVARRSAPSLLSVCLSRQATSIVVAIGPEGGWTEIEVEGAITKGYQPVMLGRNVLRAVTASVTALSILQASLVFASIDPFQVDQL